MGPSNCCATHQGWLWWAHSRRRQVNIVVKCLMHISSVPHSVKVMVGNNSNYSPVMWAWWVLSIGKQNNLEHGPNGVFFSNIFLTLIQWKSLLSSSLLCSVQVALPASSLFGRCISKKCSFSFPLTALSKLVQQGYNWNSSELLLCTVMLR